MQKENHNFKKIFLNTNDFLVNGYLHKIIDSNDLLNVREIISKILHYSLRRIERI